jgi:hypothetical protein
MMLCREITGRFWTFKNSQMLSSVTVPGDSLRNNQLAVPLHQWWGSVHSPLSVPMEMDLTVLTVPSGFATLGRVL